MLDDLTPDQRRLANLMSALSEEAYCAAWMCNLEHVLWRAVIEGPQPYGRLEIGDRHIRALRGLAEKCGGWIIFDDAREEIWLPMSEWAALYDASAR